MHQTRESTAKNYISIWRQFNKFLINLDKRPSSWEERVALYCRYLVDNGSQSSSIKSYISAIKAVLRTDGYQWSDDKVALNIITKGCRMINDTVKTRLPIEIKLLELLLFEIDRKFSGNKTRGKIISPQSYLQIMYTALFLLAYYGLMRIGELTTGSHPVKAKDIHIARNKENIMIILYSSKTHDKANRPQEIKNTRENNTKNKKFTRFFCPFRATRQFLMVRGPYTKEDEPFFVFSDGSPVQPRHARSVLKDALLSLNLDPSLYEFHSIRSGRASQMQNSNFSIEEIKRAGRWKSSAVYKYIRGSCG